MRYFINKLHSLSCLSAVISAILVSSAAIADDYPSRPITLIVPYSAGGITDTLARTIADKLTVELGQPVVVDYKPGANAVLGSELVAKASPDGYTLMLGSSTTHTVNPWLYKKLSFDVFSDFQPISKLTVVQNIIVVDPKLPINNLNQLISYAQSNPGKLSFASAGIGSSLHLYGELFKSMTKTDLVHVPYKGGAPARNDLLAGHVQIMFSDVGAIPFVQNGKLRALAVTGSEREPLLPDIPTAQEAGLTDYTANAWFAMFAPAKTPEPVVTTVRNALAKVMDMPDVRKRLIGIGMKPVELVSTLELEQAMRTDYEKWGATIKAAGVEPE